MHFISLGLGLGSSIGGEESISVVGWLTDRNCGKIQQLASLYGPCPLSSGSCWWEGGRIGGKPPHLSWHPPTCPGAPTSWSPTTTFDMAQCPTWTIQTTVVASILEEIVLAAAVANSFVSQKKNLQLWGWKQKYDNIHKMLVAAFVCQSQRLFRELPEIHNFLGA